MTKKRDKLSFDIVELLEKYKPHMLRHNEIIDGLWPSYQESYKEKSTLGVAISPKLKLLEASHKIKHEELWYGTLNSKVPLTFSAKNKMETNAPTAASKLNIPSTIDASARDSLLQDLSKIANQYGELDSDNRRKATVKLELLVDRLPKNMQKTLKLHLQNAMVKRLDELDVELQEFYDWQKSNGIFQGEAEARRSFSMCRAIDLEVCYFRNAVNEISNLLHSATEKVT